MLDRGLWKRLIDLEQEFARRGKRLNRRMISDVFSVSEQKARLWEFSLRNRDIIRHKPGHINVSNGDRLLGLFDIHIPYQDDSAVEAALSHGDRYDPTIILLGGDLIDFYQISSFVKNPEKKSMDNELKQTHSFLVSLRNRFPLARIIFMEGNHEYRFERFVLQNASAIYSLVDDLIQQKLGLASLNIEYQKGFFKIGKLWFLHGHERPTGGNPEYICNVVFKNVLDHFICGHHHRTQEKIFKRIDGSTYYGGSVGYLAGAMDYAPINAWSQGFLTVNYGDNGRFQANLHKIQDGEVY